MDMKLAGGGVAVALSAVAALFLLGEPAAEKTRPVPSALTRPAGATPVAALAGRSGNDARAAGALASGLEVEGGEADDPTTRTQPFAVSAAAGPVILSREEGAARLAAFLVAADVHSDVPRLGAAVAGDPEMAELLAREAEALRRSDEPALRARGAAILAGLGRLDVESWRQSVIGEPDPAARADMVRMSPEDGDAASASFLLDRARADDAPEVRREAIRALPAGLDDRSVAALSEVLRSDPDPTVRAMAVTYFRGAGSSHPEAVAALLAAARSADEDPEVRRAAASALLRIEADRPGTLGSRNGSVSTEEELHRIRADLGRDAG